MPQQELPAPLAELTGLMTECANNGDYAGAARQANELVTLCRATLGERHPTVLELKVSLATLQLRAGDETVAYQEFARLLPDLVEVLGRDHLSTLSARHLLAGRHQHSLSSLAEWSQLFADEQRILGADHESVLVTREKIAEKRWEIGDRVGAMAEGEHVLAARRRVLGDDHVDTLGTRLLLAIWRGRAGDVPGAVAELEPLIGDLHDKLGDDHVHLLMARHMFTLWAPDRAGVTDAVAAWQALVEQETRVLGNEHPVTAAARHQLAKSCARRCDHAAEPGGHRSLGWSAS
ncbi:tetratricopeptide repeat protein [Mycobacterium sp. M23085]|uniref:tetratricopeptide repeat protein n=1 Tax=Mycobacterium sp. M23085 TaxID=3378087 RepID=UPI003877FC0B